MQAGAGASGKASGKAGAEKGAMGADGKWSVLSDDFAMQSKKMKDWDKASDSDEDEEAVGYPDDDDE